MISSVHYIELYINNEIIELESQESLNLRINNVLFNPTKTTTTQAEYSYSFDIPSTPKNDRILNYANVLSRVNKFHARYPAQVYADGHMIFDGSLTIQKYSAKDKMYTCNLVNIKINTLEEIFGDAVMTDIKGWEVPFDGASTINSVNRDYNTKYFFPLVSYGVFQKNYVTKDDVAATYTPKHQIDKYNKWWIESFYPSLNVVETLRKAFEWKGYTVGGSAFSDPNINWIYASCNLAQEQVPIYNLGNPKFGTVSMNVKWHNYGSVTSDGNSGFGGRTSTNRWVNRTGAIQQDLEFPYYYIKPAINASNRDAEAQYNFSVVDIWNMMDSTSNSGVSVTVHSDTYMYDPNEQVIVIPSDGWYRIYMSTSATLSGQGTSFTAKQWTTTYYDGDAFEERDVQIKRGLNELTPLEIQLIRNYDGNVELIKGKTNITYDTGDPNQIEYTYRGGSYTGSTVQNKTTWQTDYPHQELYGSKAPTVTTGLVTTTSSQRSGGYVSGSGSAGGTFGGSSITRGGTIDMTGGGRDFGSHVGTYRGGSQNNTYGYMHRDGYPMPYDQAVSEAFICGISTYGGGTVSVMRNGSSWSRMCSINNKIFADVRGMDLVNKTSAGSETISTEYCKNEYRNSTCYLYSDDSNIYNSIIQCCVYLKKNDILELVAVQRDYDGQRYACSANTELTIEAISERTEAELRADPYWGAYSLTEFPRYLNLFNFTNKEKKVSDWISDIQKAFNLEIVQDGNTIEINTNQGIKKNIINAVDVDDRVSNDEAESEYISYPKEMSVKYKIDTDEWGFELTVPEEHINDEGDEWKKWGDSGFTIISLSDDTYETKTQNTQTNFSYTYYDNFLWKEVLQDGTETDYSGLTITIPVIEKAEYMAEGYGYDEAMKHDGYSMTQRFWYRDQVSQEYVWLADHMHEKVWLTYPMNAWERFNLSYKDSEKSIVTEYFNISPMLSSNYVKIDVYITPGEYKQIKGGALVHFDSDLYYTSEISGYDPSGSNPTTLKLIKKT